MPVFYDHLEQGSAEWLAFRKDKISATDIAVIMGISPYCSPYQLWQRKLCLIPEVQENDAMRRGKDLEPIALEAYSKIVGYEMEPRIVTHTSHNWAMASLDAMSKCSTRICEIKCMGKKNHEEAMNGDVKPLYMYQMQWQMFVTDLSECDYFVFSEESNHVIMIKRDQDLINEMVVKAKDFLHLLDTITPPPFTDLDYQDKRGDPYWDSLCDSYSQADDYEKAGKKQKDEIRKQMIEYSDGLNTKGTRSKFTKVITKGRVDYSKIEILKDFDLEPYRGEDTISYRLTMEKPNG